MQLITIEDPSTIIDRFERVRTDYGDIPALTATIKEHGQLVPILVTRNTEGAIELVDGGRRRKACIEGKMPIIAVLRESLSNIELREFELRANLERKDLTWQERTRGIAELDALKKSIHGEKGPGRNQEGWSFADTANIIGKDTARVSQHVTLSKAMEVFPEIATAKTERDATKLLRKIEEKVLIAELIKRKKAGAPAENPAAFAENHYIIRDAFEGMKALKGEIFDFANVDTPYGIDLTRQKKIKTDVRTDADYTEWASDIYIRNVHEVAREVYRLLKSDTWMIFWFGIEWYQEVFTALFNEGFAVDKIPAVWYGGAGQAQTMQPELYLGRSYETFFICRKGKPILHQRGRANVFEYNKLAPQNKIHPTEKPIELMQEMYKTFILPGSLIISPFLGSGVDLRAAYSLGSAGLGFELDQNLKNKFMLKVEQDVRDGRYKG